MPRGLVGAELIQIYGRTKALSGVSITISPGTVTCLMGPSGAGKSALVRTLSLLDPPWEGTVSIDKDTYSFHRGYCAGRFRPWPRVTVVFQQLFLWPHMTLRQNIEFPAKQRKRAILSLDSMVDLFDMDQFLDRYPNEVSIGQRQRAALARAAVLGPSYILLDEITAALDVEQSARVVEYLLPLLERGVGILVATHALDFAWSICSRATSARVVFLDCGRVVEEGELDILRNPRTERLRKFVSKAPGATIGWGAE